MKYSILKQFKMKTQRIYLEHANISVHDLDASIRFFTTAFPDFKVRGGGEHNGRKWIHLGNDVTYVALNSPLVKAEKVVHPIDYIKNGFNHIGFVVEDVNSIADRLLAEGFIRDYPKQVEATRIRDYFIDADGNEFEFVEYLSEDLAERNAFN